MDRSQDRAEAPSQPLIKQPEMNATLPPPSTEATPSVDRDAADAAAAARAAREEALRILLETPDDNVPPTPSRSAIRTPAVIDVSGSSSLETGLPVIPSAARAASAPLTLLEVGLGFLVLVLAGTLLVLAAKEYRGRVRAERGAAELRALAAAFENYHRETGEWPAAAPARGGVPAGLEKSISAEMWSRPTPLGGHYAWLRNAGKKTPALAITAFVPDAPLTLSRDEQRRIDRLLDDGDLQTGRFQSGFNGWPVYFLRGKN